MQLPQLLLQTPFLYHAAMVALQNAAAVDSTHDDRDDVIFTNVSAICAHHDQNGILITSTDLVAYHSNQCAHPPITSYFCVTTRVVADNIEKLYVTP